MQQLAFYLQKKNKFTPILVYNFMHVNCFNLCIIKFYFQLLSISRIVFANEILAKFLTAGHPPFKSLNRRDTPCPYSQLHQNIYVTSLNIMYFYTNELL